MIKRILKIIVSDKSVKGVNMDNENNGNFPKGTIFTKIPSLLDKMRIEKGIPSIIKMERDSGILDKKIKELHISRKGLEKTKSKTLGSLLRKEIKSHGEDIPYQNILQCNNLEVKSEMAFELKEGGFPIESIVKILRLKQEEVERIFDNKLKSRK